MASPKEPATRNQQQPCPLNPSQLHPAPPPLMADEAEGAGAGAVEEEEDEEEAPAGDAVDMTTGAPSEPRPISKAIQKR